MFLRGAPLLLFCWAVFFGSLPPIIAEGSQAEVLALDPQAVFCSYYSLSGEDPEDLDIEELYWNQEKPTFTSFKPAEMFSHKSLGDARRELENQISLIGRDTVFRWEPEGALVRATAGGTRFRFHRGPDGLPQATELIRAEIPAREWKLLERALRDISWAEITQNGESTMTVLLKPAGAEERLEKRNIATHDVAIPVRFVLFRPVSVETLDDAGNLRVHELQ